MENNDKIAENQVLANSEKLRKSVWEWMETIVISCLIVVFVFTFVFRTVGIDGDSMLNTLVDGERVVISNIFYTPKQGDIVVISRNYDNDLLDTSDSSSPIIKRVIAVEGQKVDIDFKSGIVYVDDEPLKESYTRTLTNQPGDIEFPVVVPEGCVFVLGDNRNESLDSRFSWIGDQGMIDRRYIMGKAIFRIYPIDKVGSIYGE